MQSKNAIAIVHAMVGMRIMNKIIHALFGTQTLDAR